MPFSASSTSRKTLDDILSILSIFFPTEKKLVAQNMLNLYRRSCLPWKKRIHI